MGEHATLAPSSAERWLECTASVADIERATAAGIIVDEGSEYAREGTKAHDIAAAALTGDLPIAEIPEDFKDVLTYVNAIYARAQRADVTLIEQKLDLRATYGLGEDAEPQFGTGDAVLYREDFRTLEVHDLKYGKGVLVSAKENVQTRIYACGALDMLRNLGCEPEKVEIHIHQVRLSDLPDSEFLTVAGLEAWRDEVVRPAVARIDASEVAYAPSEGACRWCPMKGACEAQARHAIEAIAGEFPTTPQRLEKNLEGTAALDDQALGALYDLVPFLEGWIKDVHEVVRLRLESGEDIPGWKLVEGRNPPAKWSDEDELMRRIKMYRASKKATRTVPLTPAQMLKDQPKVYEKLEDLAHRAEPGKKVVKADHPKPAIQPVSAMDFDI